MQKKEKERNPAAAMAKILFFMYFLTLVMLLLLAAVLYKIEPKESVLRIWIIAIYILSGLLGGFLIGKKTKSRKFLWGLAIGTLYFAILFLVSMLLHKGLSNDIGHIITTFLLCSLSGTVGGMIS